MVFSFQTDARPFACTLSGDADGVVVDETAGTVSIPTDRPRVVALQIGLLPGVIERGASKPLDWTDVDSDAAPWGVVPDSEEVGGFCLRSGEIDAGETSSVEATLSGPGTLSFKWKVPAGRGDYARVYLDGEVQKSIQRVTDWQTVTLDIPAGEHTVRWSYERGSGSASGEDAAFLDDVDWRPEVALSVASAFGTATPEVGTHTLVYGDEVVASAVAPEPENGTRRVCTGWTGTGSVPSVGTGTNATFVVESDSTLQWNWQTNIWISIATDGPVGVDMADGWFALGEAVVAHFSPNVDFFTLALADDTDGVTLDESARTIAIPADRPRALTLTVTELTLKSALDAGNLVWETSGEADWFPQVAVSADGVSSARSGGLSGGDEVSALETTVLGGGTFAWSWRLDAGSRSNSGVDVLLDGEWLDSYSPTTDWSQETLQITGDGPHTIRFEFWNAGTAATADDCAYIDQVTWTGAAPEAVTVDDVDVPTDWLATQAAAILAEHDGDYEAAALSTAANGVNKVWECYVAGISPTDETARFEARIEIDKDGRPCVSWTPKLSPEEEEKRVYVIYGTSDLKSTNWTPVDDGNMDAMRFFKVKVEMRPPMPATYSGQ